MLGNCSFTVGENVYKVETERDQVRITKTVGMGPIREHNQADPVTKQYTMFMTVSSAKKLLNVLELLLDE